MEYTRRKYTTESIFTIGLYVSRIFYAIWFDNDRRSGMYFKIFFNYRVGNKVQIGVVHSAVLLKCSFTG